METATTTQTTALLTVACEVPDFDSSFTAPSGSVAWDAAKVRLGDNDVRLDYDVWQRPDGGFRGGEVYGATHVSLGDTVSATRVDGSNSIHVRDISKVTVDRHAEASIALTLTTSDGSIVHLFIRGEQGNALEITEV